MQKTIQYLLIMLTVVVTCQLRRLYVLENEYYVEHIYTWASPWVKFALVMAVLAFGYYIGMTGYEISFYLGGALSNLGEYLIFGKVIDYVVVGGIVANMADFVVVGTFIVSFASVFIFGRTGK